MLTLYRFSRRAAPSGHRDAETSSSSVPDPTRATTSAGNERRRGHVRESAWHARANARMFTFERPGSNGGGQLDRSSRPRSHSFIPDISSESRDGPRSITPHPAALDSSASGPVLDPTGAQWRVPTSDLNRFRAERDRSPTRQMNARHRRLMRLHPVHRLEDDNMGPMNPYDELAYDSTDDEFTNRVLRRHMEATPQRSSQAAQNRGSNASTLPSQSSAPEAADATTSMAQYAGPTVGAGIEQIERERDLALQQLMYSHLQDQRRISEPRPDLDAMDGLNRNGYRGGQHREDDEDL